MVGILLSPFWALYLLEVQVSVFSLKFFQRNLIKSEHKLKHRNNNDLIKPILYVSGTKRLTLVSTPAKILILQTVVANFSSSRKMLTSKKDNQPSFSFCIEKFMLGVQMTNTPEIYLHDYEKIIVQIFDQHSLYGTQI